jgi:hypothetical protein
MLKDAPQGHPYIEALKMLSKQLDGQIKRIGFQTTPNTEEINNLVREIRTLLDPVVESLDQSMRHAANHAFGGGGGRKS